MMSPNGGSGSKHSSECPFFKRQSSLERKARGGYWAGQGKLELACWDLEMQDGSHWQSPDHLPSYLSWYIFMEKAPRTTNTQT